MDIDMPDGTGDADYLDALEQGICHVLATAQPDVAIYLAGADPFLGDRLGRLSLTKEGLQTRDRMVFELCRAASVPVAVAMAGGYSSDIADTVDIHFSTVETAASFWRAAQHPTSPRGAADLKPSKRRGTASLPRFVTSRALQLSNRAFCFSNVKNS